MVVPIGAPMKMFPSEVKLATTPGIAGELIAAINDSTTCCLVESEVNRTIRAAGLMMFALLSNSNE